MESYRSENDRKHRAASISEASTMPFDQRSKSRTSSSSSQETAASTSNRAPRGHSAHASSSSPASSRRNTVTSTGDKQQISPSFEYEQRTARSLTGSLSSPGSSSQRQAKNISTAQAIAVAASTASSPMFQQTSSKNTGAHPAASTVISVPGEQRKQSSSSSKDIQLKNNAKFHEEDINTVKIGNNTLVGNTHIIKVSGPVTNLDETVLSAVGMDGSLMASTISEHSTTSTASASSSTAPVMENREVSSSPISSNLSSALSYNIGYNTSPDKQSLELSLLNYSTNDCNVEEVSDQRSVDHEIPIISTICSDNRSLSQDNISKSKFSTSSAHSLSTSDLSELQNNKDQNKDNAPNTKLFDPLLSTKSNKSVSKSNSNETPIPPLSPKRSLSVHTEV